MQIKMIKFEQSADLKERQREIEIEDREFEEEMG